MNWVTDWYIINDELCDRLLICQPYPKYFYKPTLPHPLFPFDPPTPLLPSSHRFNPDPSTAPPSILDDGWALK